MWLVVVHKLEVSVWHLTQAYLFLVYKDDINSDCVMHPTAVYYFCMLRNCLDSRNNCRLLYWALRTGYWCRRADIKGSDVPSLGSLFVVEGRMSFQHWLVTVRAFSHNNSSPVTSSWKTYFPSNHLISHHLLLLSEKDIAEDVENMKCFGLSWEDALVWNRWS